MFFKRKKPVDLAPSILGCRLGSSFELDSLMLRLSDDNFTTSKISPTQIIQAAGIVDLGGTYIYRFYTDDEAFLQIVAEGGTSDECVVDVKLFHYYDTYDCTSQKAWDELLQQKIGVANYELEGNSFTRVWSATGDYHPPVHMSEKTYEKDGEHSVTDQFTMLFERPVEGDNTESLFLSAEEVEESNGTLSRCLVVSTGMTLSPSHLTIHG